MLPYIKQDYTLLYKDFELLQYKQEEGESIEPKFFLPIIPTVLINGSSGIAVGFASNILNRDVKSIIECCQKILTDKKIDDTLTYSNIVKLPFP